jgi:hypothetical protein
MGYTGGHEVERARRGDDRDGWTTADEAWVLQPSPFVGRPAEFFGSVGGGVANEVMCGEHMQRDRWPSRIPPQGVLQHTAPNASARSPAGGAIKDSRPKCHPSQWLHRASRFHQARG